MIRSMRLKKSLRTFVVLVALISVVGAVAYYFGRQPSRQPSSNTPSQSASTDRRSSLQQNNTLHVVAMGDMLAHDSIVAQAKSGTSYDFKPYFAHIRPLYKDADVVFCNPETPSAGAAFGISGYPTFNAPTEFARDIVSGAGCNLINLATNHMNDKHQPGINANVGVWEALKPLAYAGSNRSAEEQATIHYFTKNGIKVAFLAYADYSNDTNLTPYGINFYHNDQFVKSQVAEARANADAVIVSCHWGTEDSTVVNADQAAEAQKLADWGADVIIGTGPHVVQKLTHLDGLDNRKTLVWYSIGNMLSSQLELNELTGIIAGFQIQKTTQGKVEVSKPTAQITFMSYDWSAADKAAQRLNTRSNLTLKPLRDSSAALTSMFGPQASVNERESFVRDTLGTDANPQIMP